MTMKKRCVIIVFVLITVLSLAFAFVGCNASLDDGEAWGEYEQALSTSKEYLQNKNYLVKYRYKDGDVTVTQKLNVSYGNSNIDGWDDFIIANKGVEKASKVRTDYVDTYFGYSLKSGVKAKKASREDYKFGYIAGNVFVEGMQESTFFELKSGDVVNGNTLTADEEIYKYTLSYVLGTLDGINKDSSRIISAVKNGAVTTLKIIVDDNSLYYGKYDSESNCLIVQMTVGRITKIYSADANEPVYFINYAGPKFSLPSYDLEKISQA